MSAGNYRPSAQAGVGLRLSVGRSTTRWRRWRGRPRTRARPARARSGQVGQPGGEQPTGWRSQNQANDDEGQCHREFVPTALPRCWPAGQSGHAGHGVRWMAGDFCRQRSIHRRRAGGSSNGARYPQSFRPAGCIGPRNGICARSLSCLLVAGPLPSVLFLPAKRLLFAANEAVRSVSPTLSCPGRSDRWTQTQVSLGPKWTLRT